MKETMNPDKTDTPCITIDNNEDEQNRLGVIYDDFLRYVKQSPEWLYGKLNDV